MLFDYIAVNEMNRLFFMEIAKWLGFFIIIIIIIIISIIIISRNVIWTVIVYFPLKKISS